MESADFDVAIIGGGPAGAAMGAYLAKAGVAAVIFERELFPRPHVGESFVPSSTRVFRDLDFIDQMEEHRFPHKYGAVWTSGRHKRQYAVDWEGLQADTVADIRFEERDQPGVDQRHTYHVDRGLFDLLLLQHANRLGAEVYEGVNVRGVDVDDDDAMHVHYRMGRREMSTSARMIIDASGRRTIVGGQLGWKVKDPVFDQFALHTWFHNYDRGILGGDASKQNYIYIHFLPVSNTWVWQIPVTDEITSIGVVTQKQNFAVSKATREKFFWDCLDTRPEFSEAMVGATQMRPLKAEGDYSYAMKNIVADRLLLIGDAARFVDPIFSTGVSIALNSARFAAPDVINALESGDLSSGSFKNFEATIRRGTKNWYDFISVYYRLNVLFTAFIRDPRYRLDVLKLLQGDVWDDDSPAVLQKMRDVVGEVEGNEEHVWHGLLNDLTAASQAPAF